MAHCSFAHSLFQGTSSARSRTIVTAFALASIGSAGAIAAAPTLHRAPAIANVIDGVIFEAGNWTPDLAAGTRGASLGNHRAVVEVEALVLTQGSPVRVTIPWRRHDSNPEAKAIVVVDAATNQPVKNAVAVRVDNVSGDVVFQPNPGSARYWVYYMPFETTGGNYPKVTYPRTFPGVASDPAWAGAGRRRFADLPQARASKIQSVNAFHSFFPMEVIATPEETAAFMRGAPGGWRVMPEHRDYSVRMWRFLPQHWTRRGRTRVLDSRVLRDEYFTFQAAVIAGSSPLDEVSVSFENFPPDWQKALTCFNCGGIDENGRPFAKKVSVPAGSIQPLWIGMQIPASQPPGPVQGDVVVSAGGVKQRLTLRLNVDDQAAVNHGFDEPELMSRLAWLNSTAGTDPDFIIQPFTPVTIDPTHGPSVSVLGRTVELGTSGLPNQILSSFTPEGVLGAPASPVLAEPIALRTIVDGLALPMRPGPLQIKQDSRGRASWTVESESDALRMTVRGALEYDGMLDYRIAVQALTDVAIDDVVMPIAYQPGAAEYMLGLGRKGGKRPDRLDWTWKVENHQEGMWLGGVNRGLQYVLRDDNYERPLNTNFYLSKPLNLPPSWYNGGKGAIHLETTPTAVIATNTSGSRRLTKGEILHFNVRFLITPFKPVDTTAHFNTRFVHKYVPVDEVKAAGGTVVNIHHANEINPYINYPFFNLDKQTAYIEEAHAKGIKVKLYDTIRELTYHAHELFALRSLGDEILNDGEGGGHPWMQEHMQDHYHSAWHAYTVDDAAMLDKGTSRWTNYYIEGLAWLAAHQKIDGLYLDDIAFSRETVRRIVSVLHQERGEVIIDLHSANQFNPRDGFINSAMLYMEHFPYLSRLWFGEYFDYSQPPDYFMTEVSGLPFGLMGEMLQDDGHPFRGLLYGMTSRFYGKTDPRPVWAMMNDFGIAQSRMRGYWLADTPVGTGRADILATTYVRPDGALIAIGSWSDRDETVSLAMNLKAMGLSGKLRVYAPAVEGLQSFAEVNPAAVKIPAKQGLFLRLETIR
ncbi:MAG: glycoside hydrolase domain-containing protein [Vicinamibacteria bacterium]